MSNTEPALRWYQYSLWSLMVFSTFVAVLCSIARCTHWSVSVTIVVGIGISLLGFHPLSLRKHPTAGVVFAVFGFVVRLVGLALIAYGLLFFVVEVASRLRHGGIP